MVGNKITAILSYLNLRLFTNNIQRSTTFQMRRRIDRTSERLIEQIGRLTATIRIVLEVLILEPSHDMIMSRNRRNRIKFTRRIFYKIQKKIIKINTIKILNIKQFFI